MQPGIDMSTCFSFGFHLIMSAEYNLPSQSIVILYNS